MTDATRASIYQQHGGRCSVCGAPCSPAHPCHERLIVPVEMGGTVSPENTALICDSCSGTYRSTLAPMMRAQQDGLQVPVEYAQNYSDRSKIFGIIDDYMSLADRAEG